MPSNKDPVFGASRDEEKMDKWISCIKYMLFCMNIVGWMLGATIFGMCIWMRSDPGLVDWIAKLDLWVFYSGTYVLLVSSIIVMIVAFIGCCSALMENERLLQLFVGTQALSFAFGLSGTAVLLDYSTYQSHVQPILSSVIHRLIMYSQYERVARVLNEIQETISCCGADGPYDYILHRRALPTECRDTITGNAYFYGCVDEITWYLEERSAWVAGLAIFLCLMNVVMAVLSVLLIQTLRREERAS